MKSYDDACRQVENLMAAIGGGVNAYEEEKYKTSPSPAENSFEAAVASVEAAAQRLDPSGAPVAGPKALPSGWQPAPDLAELDFTEAPEEVPSEAEVAETEDEGALDWCATGLEDLEESLIPEPLDDEHQYHDIVENAGSLDPFWQTIVRSHNTGKPQSVMIEGRELTSRRVAGCWEILDKEMGLRYLQAGETDIDLKGFLEDKDLFVWVLPSSDSFAEDLGYIHNGYVFLRKKDHD